MADRLSTALGVSHDAIDAAGIFDRFVEIDSRLYVDPHLLSSSGAPEITASAATLDRYWRETISILRHVFEHGDRFWREALKRFTFPEISNTGLGYSVGGTDGSAIGPTKAEGLVKTACEIVRAGITDPEIFELVGLFEPRVGPDLISDITVHIIERHLLQFTQRVSTELAITTNSKVIDGVTYQLPNNIRTGRHLIFLPKDVLRDLPVAFCWEDIDKVCMHNNALRARLNAMIGDNWRRATKDHKKQRLKEILIENPEALSDMIRQYRSKPAESYDFAKDILGETIWPEAAKCAATAYPLDFKTHGPVTPDNLSAVVRTICDHFRHLVEDCGLCRIFWTDDGQVRHERFAQMLFFGIADCYCKTNDVDLSPEVNSGRGPVDFKLSNGYSARALVEVKWSKNSKLVHGYETQLREYAKAEQTRTTFFLVIQVTESAASIKKVQDLRTASIRDEQPAPDIIVVDGRIKDSASHFGD